MQQQRRSFKQTAPLDQRLVEEPQPLRKEAQCTHPGIEREQLLRKAEQGHTILAEQMRELRELRKLVRSAETKRQMEESAGSPAGVYLSPTEISKPPRWRSLPSWRSMKS
jgi:hypothetical protein